MSDDLGERVGLMELRRHLRHYENEVRAAGVALVVTDHGQDQWVFAPLASLRCLPLGPEHRTTTQFHADLSQLAARVNASGRPIVITRAGGESWVMAPLAARDRIRAALRQFKR